MANKIVIGIDQSYTRTGISICIDDKLKKVTSIDFKGLKTRSEKRKCISNVVRSILTKCSEKATDTVILCERIRTFSPQGKKDKSGGLRPGYLKMTGALIATIVDTAADFNVSVYSVDTRSWKSQVVGKNKSTGKQPTVDFIQKLGFNLFLREKQMGKNKGEKIYDDDAADSACIALYGFIPAKKQKLELEQ